MLDPKIEIKKLPLSENLLRYYQERCGNSTLCSINLNVQNISSRFDTN